MSKLVDERVVQMEFDNSRFDKNVKNTMSTLDKLKSKLDFSGQTQTLEKTLNGVNPGVLEKTLSGVEKKFSAIEIAGITAISNISNRLTNLGVNFVESLSTDNIASGFDKYSQKTTSIATLIAQDVKIAGQTIGEGITDADELMSVKMEAVNEQMEKLNWFTDETSYTFTDMVSNIGKFTAAGQDLDESVNAMMGIANWAALSGQNASTASRAMYQLSQAMGKGKVTLEDYESIQNANMDTKEFREKALESAIEAGTLYRSITGDYLTKSGNSFTVDQFTNFLTADGWLTSDVLMNTLNKYSNAVNELYDAYSDPENTKTTSELIAEMGDSLDEFGVKAFKAAQEAKTFDDVISSVKEAVASTWMQTFENIFGSYEKAKVLWTDLANELYDVFAEGGNKRNEILALWNELGGRDDIFANTEENTGAFWNLFYAIKEIINLVKDSWEKVFPSKTAEESAKSLKTFTEKLKSFTEGLRLTEDKASKIQPIFVKIFSILKFGLNLIKASVKSLKPIGDFIKDIFGKLTAGLKKAGNELADLSGNTEFINKFSNYIYKASTSIVNAFKKIGEFASSALDKVKNFFKSFKKDNGETSEDDEGEKLTLVERFFNTIAKIFEKLKNLLDKVTPILTIVFASIKKFIDNVWNSAKKLFTGENFFENLLNMLKTGTLLVGIKALFDTTYAINRFSTTLKNILRSIYDVFESISGYIDAMAFERYANVLKTVAISIALIVASVIALALMDEDKLSSALATLIYIVGILVGLAGVLKILSSIGKDTQKSFISVGATLFLISLSIVSIVSAINKLTKINADELSRGFLYLTLILTELTIVSKLLSNKKQMFSVASSMISFAVALNLMIIPLKAIGSMDVATLGKALGTIAIITAILVFVPRILKSVLQAERLASFTKSLGMLGLSLMALIIPLYMIGSMSVATLAKALGVLLIVSAIMVFIPKILKTAPQAKNLSSFTKSLGMFGLSLMALMIPLHVIGSMSVAAIAKALVVILAVSAIMVFIPKLIKRADQVERLSGVVGSMILLASALTILSVSLLMLSLVPWTSLGKAGVILLGISALMVIVGKVLGVVGAASIAIFAASMNLLAFSLIVLAVGLGMLTPVMLALSSIPVSGLLIALGVLAGFGLLSAVLAPLIPIMLGFSAAILILSAGIALFVAAVALLVPTIVAFSAISAVALASFIATLTSLFSLIPAFIQSVVDGIVTGVLAIIGAIPDILSALEEALPAIFEFLGKVGAEFVDFALNLVADIIGSAMQLVIDKGPEFVDKLIEFINTIADIIEEKTPAFLDALEHLFTSIYNSITYMIETWVPKIVTFFTDELFPKIKEVGEDIIGKIKEGITTAVKGIGDWVKDNIIDPIVNKFNDIKDKFEKIGKNVIEGLKKGIEDTVKNVETAVTNVANDVGNWFKNVLGIKSPSRVFAEYGKFIDLGLAKGIEDNEDSAIDATDSLTDGVTSAMLAAKDILNGGLDDDIVIKPVLDLSEIQNGAKNIYSMMNNIDGYSIRGSADLAAETSSLFNYANRSPYSEDSYAKPTQTTNNSMVNNNTFNIQGNNPKEIAQEVSDIIQKQVERRRVSWA